MNWRLEQIALLRAREETPPKALERDAVKEKVIAMLNRVQGENDDWLGWPLVPRLISRRDESDDYRLQFYVLDDSGIEVELIKAAASDPVAWNEAVRLTVEFMERGKPVPECLKGFAIQVMNGAKPKTRGRKRNSHKHKFSICLAIFALKHVGINPTCNAASSLTIREATGCGLVASFFNLSYEAIASVWEAKDKVFAQRSDWEFHLERLLYSET
ncbi:hypothetical protein JJD61_18975 [Pseudomonas carnis]|uniref:hypothetical protein n=1 Tax=Pseudomonas carnis TaxID=2487355 RepID=UPI00190B7919|nr:hypothetical protein [Pseudomonas carnis]MBK3472779.1 hypothetical protein [Pseudomonas carnis]